MDREQIGHWQAADAAFDRWLDVPESGRGTWLDAQDLREPVRRRLEQLITAHESPRATLAPDGGNLAGCRLGAWTLDAELGRGGMAVVYRAWREANGRLLKMLASHAAGVTRVFAGLPERLK